MCPNLFLVDLLGSRGLMGPPGLQGPPGEKGSPGPKGDTGVGIPGIVGVLRTHAHKSDTWHYAIYLWANNCFQGAQDNRDKKEVKDCKVV